MLTPTLRPFNPLYTGPVIVLPHFTRSLLARSFALWLFLRFWTTAGSVAANSLLDVPPSHPLLLSPRASLLLVGLVVGVGLFQARRRNEDLFFRCLGYGRSRLLATLAAPALLLEVVIAVVART